MDIAPYIQELLTENDQVSLPDFGLFMKRRVQGYFDAASGKLCPPTERLELLINSSPSDDLANFISARKHISKASASYFISQFVTQLKNKLQAGDVLMPGLGIIRISHDNYILSEAVSLPNGAFGLGVINDPVIPTNTKKQVQKQPLPIVEDAVFADEKPSGTPLYVYWLLIFLIALLSAGIAYYFHPEWFPFVPSKNIPQKQHTDIPQAKQAVPEEKPADSVLAEDTAKPAIVKTDAANAKKIPVKTAADNVQQVEPQEYEIIGASFKTLTSAKEQVKRFGWKNVPAKILKNTPGKRIKISLGSFNDATAAQMELKRLKAELNNKELFIEPYKKK